MIPSSSALHFKCTAAFLIFATNHRVNVDFQRSSLTGEMYFFGLFLFIIWSSSAFESRDKGWLGVVCPWVSVAIIITMQHYTTIQPCNTVQHFSRMKRCNTMVWCFCQSTNNGMRHKTWCACTCKTQLNSKNKKHNETVWCQMYQQKTWTAMYKCPNTKQNVQPRQKCPHIKRTKHKARRATTAQRFVH